MRNDDHSHPDRFAASETAPSPHARRRVRAKLLAVLAAGFALIAAWLDAPEPFREPTHGRSPKAMSAIAAPPPEELLAPVGPALGEEDGLLWDEAPSELFVVSDDPVLKLAAGPVTTGKPHSQVPITGGTAQQRAAIKSILKKWGTYTNVRAVKIQPKLSRSGLSTMYGDGSVLIEIRKAVGAGSRLTYTFTHELAHAQAAHVYGGDYATADRRLKSAFGPVKQASSWKGLEAAADCGAHYMTGTKKHLYYKPAGCSVPQRASAKKIAQGYTV